MMPTLQLTPEAAGRLYHGPRFHRSRSPEERRQVLRDQIRTLKNSPSLALRYIGHIAEAISKIRPKDLQPKNA